MRCDTKAQIFIKIKTREKGLTKSDAGYIIKIVFNYKMRCDTANTYIKYQEI